MNRSSECTHSFIQRHVSTPTGHDVVRCGGCQSILDVTCPEARTQDALDAGRLRPGLCVWLPPLRHGRLDSLMIPDLPAYKIEKGAEPRRTDDG